MTTLKRTYAALALGFFTSLPAHADLMLQTIQDNYYGADNHGYGDVIGTSFFDISKMTASVTGGILDVKVYTHFKQGDSQAFGTQNGDLFLSTNGWHPNGTAATHYITDNASNGERWEYVFDTSANTLYGGNFTILNSEDVMTSGTYRNGQEVLRGTGGSALNASRPVIFGSEMVNGVSWNTILYQIQMTDLGTLSGNELGLKWGMTCANDTIEGALVFPASEPGALSLVALGLLSVPLMRRRKRVPINRP